ncbi:hypothetical protein [Vibrio stylophorae]|nr:hypothetical protein [Vibrio stylophorae]
MKLNLLLIGASLLSMNAIANESRAIQFQVQDDLWVRQLEFGQASQKANLAPYFEFSNQVSWVPYLTLGFQPLTNKSEDEYNTRGYTVDASLSNDAFVFGFGVSALWLDQMAFSAEVYQSYFQNALQIQEEAHVIALIAHFRF